METELKLELATADVPRLAQSMLLGARASIDQLDSTYFDTTDGRLARAGFTLRIRRDGARRMQTIKAGGGAASGLFVRPEWEREVPGDQPVLDAASGPLEAVLKNRAVEPRFSVQVTRSTWLVEGGGARIEVALDEGTIHAGGRAETFAELELELKVGPVGALFAVARQLGEVAPLRLGTLSKADRGVRLLEDSASAPVKVKAIRLDAEGDPAAALSTIAHACLQQFRLNENLLLSGDTRPQPLHQARVGLRRLRSALSLFKPLLAGDVTGERLAQALRGLAASLGEVRDLDVLFDQCAGPERAQVAAAREAAFAVLLTRLNAAETRLLLLELCEWLAIGAWRAHPADTAHADDGLIAFAAELLDRQRRRLKRQGRHLARLDDEQRHRARIQAKKLRYAAEFFGSLWLGKKAGRRRETFLAAIEALQEDLGLLNDAAVAPALRASLGLPVNDAAVPLDRKAARKRAGKALTALMETKPFWR